MSYHINRSKDANYLQLCDYAIGYKVFDLCFSVIDDNRFPLWSASSKPDKHHYGQGGLVRHTLEVVDLCVANNKLLVAGIDESKLFLAAFFHDVGKMWDYEPVTHLNPYTGIPNPWKEEMAEGYELRDWRGTSHKRNIHHISRSSLVWNKAANENNWNEKDTDEVTHAILAHHGCREWGSPISPATKLGWMLHLCDNMSAKMDDCEKGDRFKDGK